MNPSLWLVDLAVKSTALLLVAGLLSLALSRRSAALRHLIWGLALVATLALPVLSLAVPQWSTPVGLPMPGSAWLVGAGEATPAAPAAETPEQGDRLSASSAVSAVDQLRASPPEPASVETFRRAEWAVQAAAVARTVAAGWSRWLIPLWVAGGALILMGLALAVWRTWRLRRMAHPAPVQAQALVRGVAARLGMRRSVTALQLTGDVMPMTFGVVRPVILLPAAATAWEEDRLRAVLLHEMAHVKRHDCLTQLLARCACALYWFNPLVWMAARRLRVERELACDDLVLASGSRASDYATHLLEIARGLRVGPLAGVASIAMARPSQLAGRLLAVLDGSRARDVVTGRLAAGGLAAALAILAPLAGARVWETNTLQKMEPTEVSAAAAVPPARQFSPASVAKSAETWKVGVVPEPEEPWSLRSVVSPRLALQASACAWDGPSSSASHNVQDDQFTIRLKVGGCTLRVDGEGDVTFSDNDDDVTALSRGGFFHIEERGGDAERRIEIEPGPGDLLRKWFVEGEERPYDAAARAWLAQRLLVVFRRTGLDAEKRAQRILRKGGVDAVLQEVAQIPSDWAARQYYQVLLTRPNLDQATLLRVVRQAGQEIGSDFELAELLIAVAKQQPLEETVRLAYVEAVGSIGSDFERHRALKPVLLRQGLSREMAAAMLASAKEIGSDFELAGLLIEIADAHAIDATLAPAFFDALASISSDFERHRVLTAVARQARGDQAVLDRALEAAAAMRSDFELASFLSEVSSGYPADRPLPPAFLRAAATIGSAFELRRAMSGLVTRGGATSAQLASVLEAARGITSDFELAELLVTIAQRYSLDDVLRPVYFAAAQGIGGDFEHGRALKAVIARKPLSEATVLALIESSAGINSDFELAEVLIAISRAYPVNERLRPVFLKAAEHISSEHERGRVLSAIFPRSAPAP